MRYLFHIPIALILGFIAAVALTFYLVTQTTLVPRAIHLLLARYIESKYDVTIEFERLSGSYWSDLTVENVRVDTRTPGESYRIVKIDRIDAYYDFRRLWRGDWHIDSLFITAPALILRSDSTGRVLLPKSGAAKPATAAKRALPNVTIDRFVLDDGRFQWSRQKQTLYFDSIYVALRGSLQNDVIAINFDSVSAHYPHRSFHLRELHTGLAYSNGALGLDSLYVLTDSSLIVGGGLYPLTDSLPFRFSIRDSHVSLTEIGSLLGIAMRGAFDFSAEITGRPKLFEGRAQARGVLFERELGPFSSDLTFDRGILKLTNFDGQMFGGTMTGAVEINFEARPETYSGDLVVRSFNLEKVLPGTFPSRMNGAVALNGSGFGENSFTLDLTVDCPPGQFDWVRYDSLRGEITLNVEDMYFQPGFTLWYENSRFTTEGIVRYDGDMLLAGDFRTSQLADFWGDLFIEELSGGAYATYEVSGPVLDPDIRGRFFGDSCSFYGFSTDSLVADFDIASFMYGQRGYVDLFAWKSDVWNLPADSVRLALEIDSNEVAINLARTYLDIDSAAIETPILQRSHRMILDGRAHATIIDSTAFVTVSNFTMQWDSLEYKNTQPVQVDFLADRIDVKDAHLQGDAGLVAINCSYGFDTTIVLSLATEDFTYTDWITNLTGDTLLGGALSLDGRMVGRLANPAMTITGTIAGLVYGADSLGNLSTEIRFADSLLSFTNLNLKFRGYDINADGTFPLVMNLDSGVTYVPEKPLDLNIRSAGNDLGIVSSFNDQIESLTGDFNLDLEIYGTPQQPQSRGEFNLSKGRLKVYQMTNPIEDIEAKITSNGKQVIVEWAEGTVRHKRKKLLGSSWRSGSVRTAGEINILTRDLWDYQLAVVGYDVPIQYELGEIYGRADFDLEVRGADPPLISGDVTVYEAEYLDEFENEYTTMVLEDVDTTALWDYNLNVEMLPGSVRVKNSDVNMVVDGTVRVLREDAKDNYIGTLNVARGTFYFLDMPWRIESGSYLAFNKPEPDPDLYIDVSTRVRSAAAGVGGSSGYIDVNATVRGTISQPQFAAAAGSELSIEDMIMLILVNQTASGANSSQLASDFQNRIQVGALGYLGTITGQALLRNFGLEWFEITPVVGEKNNIEGAAVSLGLYTLPNVYTYVSSLTVDGRADYGAEYRLGRHLSVNGRYDRDRLWRLDLLVNWEFR